MQMKMEKKAKKFDKKKVRKLLEEENEYIVDLLTTFDVPDSIEDEELDKMYLLDTGSKNKPKLFPNIGNSRENPTSNVQDDKELEDRIEIIKNKIISKKSKKSDKTKNKRIMKKMKKDKNLKKKLISVQKSLKNEKIKEEKLTDQERKEITSQQAQQNDLKNFNTAGKIVFSKFDFASHPGAKVKKTKKDKVLRNPKEILKTMKDQKKKISELIEKGQEDKAREVKQDLAWKKVFDKTEGKKIKDDVNLLQKAVKRKKHQKQKSKQKWIERKEKVEQNIAQRQKKRQENINKKLKEKKVSKLKRLSKKGRVIPGF